MHCLKQIDICNSMVLFYHWVFYYGIIFIKRRGGDESFENYTYMNNKVKTLIPTSSLDKQTIAYNAYNARSIPIHYTKQINTRNSMVLFYHCISCSILFYFILFYFILFYFILFYFIFLSRSGGESFGYYTYMNNKVKTLIHPPLVHFFFFFFFPFYHHSSSKT